MNLLNNILPGLLIFQFLLVPIDPTDAANVATDNESVLTLDQCIEIAEENHGSLITARHHLRGAHARNTIARSSLLPQITYQSNFSRGENKGSQSGFSASNFGTMETRQHTASIRQMLFDSGQTFIQIRQSNWQTKANRSDLNTARNNLVFNVTNAYFDLLRSKRLEDLAAERVKGADAQLDMVNSRIEAGDAAPVDRFQVQSEAANAQLNLLIAENQTKINKISLSNSMGQESGKAFDAVDVGMGETYEVIDLPTLLERAGKFKPELLRAKATEMTSKAGLKLALVQARPLLNANISYDRGLFAGSKTSPMSERWQINAFLSYPIFDGFNTGSKIKQAQASWAAAKANRKQTEKDVAAALEQAHFSLTNSKERISVSELAMDAAGKALDVSNERYRLGLAILIEVILSQVEYYNAKANHVHAIYDYHVAKAALDRAVGVRVVRLEKEMN